MLYDVAYGVCGVLCVQLEGYWTHLVWDDRFIPLCNTFLCYILSTCPITSKYMLSSNVVNTGHNMKYI
jgi:hypothetical protein